MLVHKEGVTVAPSATVIRHRFGRDAAGCAWAGFALLLVAALYSGRGQAADPDEFDYGQITLSTDLIAAVVDVEDDLAMAGLLSAGDRESVPVIPMPGSPAPAAAMSPANGEPESGAAVEVVGNAVGAPASSTDNAGDAETGNSGSVFSELLAAGQPVQSSTPEPAAVATPDAVEPTPGDTLAAILPAVEPTAVDATPAADAMVDESDALVLTTPGAVSGNLEGQAMTTAMTMSAPETEPPGAIVAETVVSEPAAAEAPGHAAETLASTDAREPIRDRPDAGGSSDKPLVIAALTSDSPTPRADPVPPPAPAPALGETDKPGAPDVRDKLTVTEMVEERINEDEIILSWATAWSDNDTETYLSFYADDFVPPDPGMSRGEWEQQRRRRLQNQDIRIIVSNAEIHSVSDDRVEVRFTQRYTSRSYKDRVIKSIEMVQTGAGWRFVSERTLETLPFR